jgi:hypothetical protein
MAKLGLRDLPVENIDEESLGLSDFASSLSEFVLKCETPLTISLQGDWGSGKTSLMNLVRENLRGSNPSLPVIWFNTWQYSQFDLGDDLPISLISHVIREIGSEEDKGFAKSVRWLLSKAPKVAAIAALGKKGGEAVEELTKTGDELDPTFQITSLRKKLEELVTKKCADNQEDRLVVLVDDLDRLKPEKAVELLEVLKLFLDVPHCVFMLACDYQVVLQGVKAKFGVETEGKSFFDKIIQLPFSMPIGLYNTGKYIENLLQRIGVEFGNEDLTHYVDLVTHSVGGNPRSLKRLFNSMLLLNLVAEKRGIFNTLGTATKADKQRILFAILCLQFSYEAVYNYLQRTTEGLSQSFFESSMDADRVMQEKWFQELPGSTNAKKLAAFIKVFFNAIQLKAEGELATLSNQEIANLLQLIKFSSITSTDAAMAEQPYDAEERWKNRDMGYRLCEEINKLHSNYLEQIKTKFTTYQARQSDAICVYSRINIENKHVNLEFVLDKAHILFFLTASNQWSRDYFLQWAKENCGDDYPNMKFFPNDYDFVYLLEEDFVPGTSWEARSARYREMVDTEMEIILPKLAASIGPLLGQQGRSGNMATPDPNTP